MAQTSSLNQATDKRLVIEDSVEVAAPLPEVYSRWNDFTHFPQFMSNVEEVRSLGGDRYHWVARIFGIKQEWDAEVTQREANRSISWQAITGAYNSGTVNFNELPGNKTQVRLRLEYSPPAGQIGKTLDGITKTTQREVKQDLKNFKRLLSGESPIASGRSEEDIIEGVVPSRVLAPLAGVTGAAAIGGVAAYLMEQRLRRKPMYWLTSSPVSLPWALASWGMVGASIASIATSASLRFGGRRKDALFVGQWAPTFLGMGLLYRMIGHRGVQKDVPSTIASWSFYSAAIGSIFGSLFLHLRGKRNDGLFIGQWAPTFIGGAVLSRLLARVFGN